MRLTRITVVSVPVRDQQAAKRFYTEKLGFELVREAPFGGGQWIELALPGAEAHITLVNWFPQMPPGSLQGMIFETPDVQEAYQACLSAGVDVSAVESAPWGTFFTFRDPDGNGFVVQQAPGGGSA